MGNMTWAQARDSLIRWTGVTLAGIGLFRAAFQVSIAQTVVLITVGLLTVAILRGIGVLLWAMSTALVLSGLFGVWAAFDHGSPWNALIRAEPFGRILITLYLVLGGAGFWYYSRLYKSDA